MVKADTAERFLTAPCWPKSIRTRSSRVLGCVEEDRASSRRDACSTGISEQSPRLRGRGAVVIERSFPGGRQEVLTTLTAPTVFGTTSFSRPNPSTISVRATTDIRMLTLDHPRTSDSAVRSPAPPRRWPWRSSAFSASGSTCSTSGFPT